MGPGLRLGARNARARRRGRASPLVLRGRGRSLLRADRRRARPEPHRETGFRAGAEPPHCGQHDRPRLRGRPPLGGARERRRAAPLGPRKRGGPEGERFVRPGRRFSDAGARRRRPHHGRRPKRPRQPRRRPPGPRDLAPDRHAGSFGDGRRGELESLGGSDRDRPEPQVALRGGKGAGGLRPEEGPAGAGLDPPRGFLATHVRKGGPDRPGSRDEPGGALRRGEPVAGLVVDLRGRHHVERRGENRGRRREGARGPRPRSAPLRPERRRRARNRPSSPRDGSSTGKASRARSSRTA